MNEAWKPVLDWEGYYEVSNLGRIRSNLRWSSVRKRMYGGGILRPITASKGYIVVNLKAGDRREQELVHRLVLLTFSGMPLDISMQACHNNGVRSDARLINLRWDSVSGNHSDKVLHGTSQIGSKNPCAKLTEEQVFAIRSENRAITAIAKDYCVGKSTICRIRRGLSWKHV